MMIPRHIWRRIPPTTRTFHASSKAIAAVAKPPPTSNISPSTSTTSPIPPIPRPADNDPTYVHPPSSVNAGAILKALQLLKDQPEIIALPDDYYPDWLWELFDDPKSVEERATARRAIEEKKEIYLAQRKEEETEKQLIESQKSRLLKLGEKRTKEEKNAIRRANQNDAWLVNREKEYVTRQFPMPPERNAKFHKKINKKKIKDDNYMRARGMK